MLNAIDKLKKGLPPSKKQVRVGALDTIEDYRREMSRLYRAARKGELDALVASKLAYILSYIGKSLESVELERRIEDLEAKLEEK